MPHPLLAVSTGRKASALAIPALVSRISVTTCTLESFPDRIYADLANVSFDVFRVVVDSAVVVKLLSAAKLIVFVTKVSFVMFKIYLGIALWALKFLGLSFEFTVIPWIYVHLALWFTIAVPTVWGAALVFSAFEGLCISWHLARYGLSWFRYIRSS
jgi:hypothetical protein